MTLKDIAINGKWIQVKLTQSEYDSVVGLARNEYGRHASKHQYNLLEYVATIKFFCILRGHDDVEIPYECFENISEKYYICYRDKLVAAGIISVSDEEFDKKWLKDGKFHKTTTKKYSLNFLMNTIFETGSGVRPITLWKMYSDLSQQTIEQLKLINDPNLSKYIKKRDKTSTIFNLSLFDIKRTQCIQNFVLEHKSKPSQKTVNQFASKYVKNYNLDHETDETKKEEINELINKIFEVLDKQKKKKQTNKRSQNISTHETASNHQLESGSKQNKIDYFSERYKQWIQQSNNKTSKKKKETIQKYKPDFLSQYFDIQLNNAIPNRIDAKDPSIDRTYYKNLTIDPEYFRRVINFNDILYAAHIAEVAPFRENGKVYSSLSRMRSFLRQYVRYDGSPLVEAYDITAAHFTLLPTILERIGADIPAEELNRFKEIKDIYEAVVGTLPCMYERGSVKGLMQSFYAANSTGQFLHFKGDDGAKGLIVRFFDQYPHIRDAIFDYNKNNTEHHKLKSVANEVESDYMNAFCHELYSMGLHPFRVHDAIYLPENELPAAGKGMRKLSRQQAEEEKLAKTGELFDTEGKQIDDSLWKHIELVKGVVSAGRIPPLTTGNEARKNKLYLVINKSKKPVIKSVYYTRKSYDLSPYNTGDILKAKNRDKEAFYVILEKSDSLMIVQSFPSYDKARSFKKSGLFERSLVVIKERKSAGVYVKTEQTNAHAEALF